MNNSIECSESIINDEYKQIISPTEEDDQLLSCKEILAEELQKQNK